MPRRDRGPGKRGVHAKAMNTNVLKVYLNVLKNLRCSSLLFGTYAVHRTAEFDKRSDEQEHRQWIQERIVKPEMLCTSVCRFGPEDEQPGVDIANVGLSITDVSDVRGQRHLYV